MKSSLCRWLSLWSVAFISFGAWADGAPDFSQLTCRIEARLSSFPGMLGKEYDALHPHYMKFCSTTKLNAFSGIQGTAVGHAVFYLKGVCVDKSRGPSGLKLCPEDANYGSPELGVGLSIDKFLSNVNFYAFPTRTLFLGAELAPGETFTTSVRERIMEKVLEDRIFEGIEFHEEGLNTKTRRESEMMMAEYAFGTDYALAMARNLYCINMPFPRSVMGDLVEYLNELNDSYAESAGADYRGFVRCRIKKDNEYHWNVIFDNCTHTPINALAKIGVLRERTANLPLVKQIGNIAIPSHAFMDLHKGANVEEIDVDDYYHDPVRREIFLKHGWIPQAEGTLTEFIPMYEDNEVYKSDSHMLVIPASFKDFSQRLRKITSKPKYSYHGSGKLGFAPNLVHFFIKYRNALENIEEKERSPYFKHLAIKGDPKQIANLENGIARIEQMMSGVYVSERARRKGTKHLAKLRKDLDKRTEAANYIAFVGKFKDFISAKKLHVQSQIVRMISEDHE